MTTRSTLMGSSKHLSIAWVTALIANLAAIELKLFSLKLLKTLYLALLL
jgi:hypothetical protein